MEKFQETSSSHIREGVQLAGDRKREIKGLGKNAPNFRMESKGFINRGAEPRHEVFPRCAKKEGSRPQPGIDTQNGGEIRAILREEGAHRKKGTAGLTESIE